jgi:cytoskeletal protein CcmA (bactofilin family)
MIASNQAFCYFRAVFLSGVGASIVSISEWVLNGTIESVNITADGRVGLGVVAPVEALEVAGNMVVSGNMSAGNMGMFRNRIINGDMRIDQRNSGATVANASLINGNYTFTLDRFAIYKLASVTLTVNQNSISDLANFRNSLRVTNVSAASITTDLIEISHKIEGYNIADLGFGKANTNTITISFWVKSSITGMYSYTMRNYPINNRSIVMQYQILSANTWEYKTVTVPVDASGTWASNSAAGVDLYFSLIGTAGFRTSSLNTWLAGDFKFITGTTYANWIGTAGATWELTGLQIEKGTLATPFEFRPYAIELQLCQRYYFRKANQSPYEYIGYGLNEGTASVSTNIQCYIPLPVAMRSNAIYSTVSNSTHLYLNGATLSSITQLSNVFGSPVLGAIYVTLSSAASFTAWAHYAIRFANVAVGSGFIDFNAEL